MINYKLIMPEDMNHNGFLFGGKLLMWVDEFAWIAACADFPESRFVTRGMSEVSFCKGVSPASILTFEINQARRGKTSVTYHVDVYAKKPLSRITEHVFNTDITFVWTKTATRPRRPERRCR